MRTVTSGRAVVRVCASSANLGPGFDVLGFALDWTDELCVEVTSRSYRAEVTGEGAQHVPHNERNLVLASVLAGLRALGLTASGLLLTAHNTIPHGRGVGSSAAAIVAGYAAAWTLAHPHEPLDRGWVFAQATAVEGHGDNAGASVYGGLVLVWDGADGPRHLQVRPHAELAAVAFVPPHGLATTRARSVLPAAVPREDAIFNAGRTALLVHAASHDPDLLLDATADRLHQGYRAALMPATASLVKTLRADGFAAFVSGAGPTVLVLGAAAALEPLAHRRYDGFTGRPLAVGVAVEATDGEC